MIQLKPLLQGFAVGIGLIVAIGPQNAFILKQGLKNEYLLLTAITCSIIDAILISVGVGGFGTLVSTHPVLIEVAKWFGALFLFFFGLNSFRLAFQDKYLNVDSVVHEPESLKKIILLLLAFGFLNPHAYLDAVVLIGSIAAQHPANQRYLFGIGAIFASFCWFFSLTFGARILNPFFKNPKAWKYLDIIIGIIMWGIALTLIFEI